MAVQTPHVNRRTPSGVGRFFALLLLTVTLTGCANQDWKTASREPAGIAPAPEDTPEAVIQVYGAPVYGWRGWFAIHTWIAVKPSDAQRYTVYEVIGWRERRGLPALRIEQDYPDRFWFGEKPELLLSKQGAGVDQIIAKIDHAAKAYPWAKQYTMFPGPNSNTFPSWIGEQVPELGLDLPLKAIGQDY